MPRLPRLPVGGRWLWCLLLVWLVLMFCLLPYDSTLRLSVRFVALSALNSLVLTSSLQASLQSLIDDPSSALDQHASLGIIVKTGYGTQHRVPPQLRVLGVQPNTEKDHVVVIADFNGRLDYSPSNGSSKTTASITVHDVIAPVIASRAVLPYLHSSLRVDKYRSLAAAIREGNATEAQRISRNVGWELDAMKFIPGLELAYTQMPHKDWYLLLDDDTFVVPSSLHLLLSLLNPARPLYAGNAVGDFRARFAHGGSAVLLSRAAVTQLLDAPSRAAVHLAYVDSLTEVWGDKLLATTLMRVGVYIDERFTHFFNGGRPRATRISADRFCLPLVSFHGLADPAAMTETGNLLGSTSANSDFKSAFLWGDLWALFRQPTIASLRQKPMRTGRDFVGQPGGDSSSAALVSAVPANVASANECWALCDKSVNCLAWTWNAPVRTCTTSPWLVVGEGEEPDEANIKVAKTISGVHADRLQQLVSQCSQRKDAAWTVGDEHYALAWL